MFFKLRIFIGNLGMQRVFLRQLRVFLNGRMNPVLAHIGLQLGGFRIAALVE
ncbi:hypothetical protein D3C76_1810400 [compost metagenome]